MMFKPFSTHHYDSCQPSNEAEHSPADNFKRKAWLATLSGSFAFWLIAIAALCYFIF